MSDWSTPHGQEANKPIHIYPLRDTREHVLDGLFCPCMPKMLMPDAATIDGVECQPDHSMAVIRHNSYDGRELLQVVKAALDEMGKALAEHNHTWSRDLRDHYEHAIDLIQMRENEKP